MALLVLADSVNWIQLSGSLGLDAYCRGLLLSNEPTILYECDDWLVVNKPANWHTVKCGKRAGSADGPESAGSSAVLEDWIVDHDPELSVLPEGGILHRLDFATTGCVIVARSGSAYERLHSVVRSGSGLSKIYRAVVKKGIAARGDFELFFSSRYRRSTKVTVRVDGKAANRGACNWRLLPLRLIGNDDVLIEVELVGAGQRHQIRAGFAYLGSPLQGDEMYGGCAGWKGGLGLHAYQIVLEGQSVMAPTPANWGLVADKRAE